MADANWRPHTPSDFDKSSTPTIDRHSFFQKAASPPKSAKSQRRFPGSPPPPERENEKEKKTKYNSRVINTERASFIPLVFTTAATTAPECNKFHKRLAELIATKRKEKYSDVINYIRTRISFAMLKAVLLSIHGIRGKKDEQTKSMKTAGVVAFGLIPSEDSYKCR